MKKTRNQHIEEEIIEQTTGETNAATDNMSEEAAASTAKETIDWQDRYIRLSAEFDNYRKRTLKEKMELIENGGADFIKTILPTIDDLERALPLMQESTDKQGINLIRQNLLNSLKSKGVTEIEAIGKPFDVDFHEAIAKVPATEQFPEGVIMDVIQKGYMIKDKVLRFAKVVVAE